MEEGSSAGPRNGLWEHQFTTSEMTSESAGDRSPLVKMASLTNSSGIGRCAFPIRFRADHRLTVHNLHFMIPRSSLTAASRVISELATIQQRSSIALLRRGTRIQSRYKRPFEGGNGDGHERR